MKNYLCDTIFNWLTSGVTLNADEKEDLYYSIKCRYNEIYVLFWIMLCSMILNNTGPALVSVITFNFLRARAGGLHARSLNRCAIISTLILTLLPYCTSQFALPDTLILALFAVAPLLFYKYAPTSAHIDTPLPDNAVSLKKKATLRAVIVLAIAILIKQPSIKYYMLCSVYAQLLSNTPILYYYLQRRNHHDYQTNVN